MGAELRMSLSGWARAVITMISPTSVGYMTAIRLRNGESLEEVLIIGAKPVAAVVL